MHKLGKSEDKEKGHSGYIHIIFGMSVAVICFMLLLAAVGGASAATYYVSPSSSDSYDGLSLDFAWASIQHAADTVEAGDTVLVQSGTYTENVIETTSGTADNRIIYQGVDNPIINAGSGTGFKIEGDYVTVTGFTFKKANKGVWVYGADHVTVTNNIMDDFSCSVGIYESGTVYYLEITHNTVNSVSHAIDLNGDLWHSNISHNAIHSSSTGAGTLYCWTGWRHYVDFIGNTIRGGRNGFGGLSGDHCHIADNNISGYYHNGLNLHGDQYCTVENNWVGAPHPDNPNPNGIYIDGTTTKSFGNIYRNNIAIDTGSRAFTPCNAYNAIVLNQECSDSWIGVQVLTAVYKDYSLQSGKWAFKNLTVNNVDTYAFKIENIFSDSTDYGHYKLIDSNLAGNPSYSDIGFNTIQLPVTLWIVNTKLADNDIAFYESPTSHAENYYYLDVKVEDENGNPVEGAIVTVENIDNPSYSPINMEDTWPPTSISTTHTESNGHIPLPGNASGTMAIMDYLKTSSSEEHFSYKITAEKDGYSTSTTVNPDSSWYRADPNTYQNTVVIVLPTTIETGSISGTVTNSSNGAPIKDARVETGTRYDNTDEYGEYTISNIPAGTYTVTASVEGYENASESATVIADQTTRVNFALTFVGDTTPPTTTYTITPTPNEAGWNNVTPVVVTAFRSDSGGSGISYTNYSKTSEIGPWTTVTIGTATGPDAENVTAISESGFNVTVPDEGTTQIWYYSVDSDSNVEHVKDVTVKIATTATGNISGIVTNTTGATIHRATVTVEGTVKSAETDANGVYTLTDVPINTYTVTCTAPDYKDSYKYNIEVSEGVTTTVIFALISSTITPLGDLAGEWRFEEGAGGVAVDSSGNENNGIIHSGSWTEEGQVGTALEFDGLDDYVSIPNSPTLNPADEITISAWVNPGVIPQAGWNKIIAKPYTNSAYPWQQYALTLHDNKFVFELNTEGTKDVIASTETVEPNTWYHVTGTYDGSEMRIYVNAALKGTLQKSGAIAAYPTDVHIGAGIYSDAETEYITGTIDEVKIYSRALSAEEIKTDYEDGSSNLPPVADPKGPYTGTEGIPITFDGSGSYDPDGSIISYAWDFGDGNTTTGVSPTHIYAQNGTYTVTLAVTDDGGATDTNTTTATIADTEPTAGFTATPVSGPKPLTVAFTDTSASYDGITAWEWDFDNDGVIDSTEQKTTYVYAEEGVYTVSLTVYESDGDSDTISKTDYITVTGGTSPTITEHSPEGTSVPIDTTITVTFSKAMNTSSAKGAFSISPSVSGSFDWNGNTMIFTPDSDLDYETTYTIIINTEAEDLAGNNLQSPYIWQFTTFTPGMDLVAEWRFDEGTGGIAVDSSGNGNDGTIYGASWIDGKLGTALKFNGMEDYISIPNSPTLNPAEEITLSAWVNPGVIPQEGYRKIIAKPYTNYTTPWQQYALALRDNQFVFELNTEETKEVLIGTETLESNTWYHVTGTYDGSEMRIYVNAALNGTISKSGAIAEYPTDVHIGAGIYSDAETEYITGTIDEVKIYNCALSVDEIQADYEAGLNGTANSLSGTVTSLNSTGLVDATVTLATMEGDVINSTLTDSTGHYEFTDVSPSDYNITATKPRFWYNFSVITVNASVPTTADIVLGMKGDFNNNGDQADAGDLVMMEDAKEAGTSDVTYDLNGDGNPADEDDLTLLKHVSVGETVLE